MLSVNSSLGTDLGCVKPKEIVEEKPAEQEKIFIQFNRENVEKQC